METIEEKKPLVLVVEDDKFLSGVHENKLSKEGFEVALAKNGEEAMAMARAKKPDIILLDLIMPVKDGFETLKELKADSALKDIKVLILSNLSQEEDKQKVMDMGAVDYIVKANVAFKEIVEAVKKILQNQ
jgi:two-component system, OmpR family, alkaline phosphatase synthesis response regulator PhoP